eukprot:PITA_13231
MQVDPNKIAIIKSVPTPQKQQDVRSSISLARYYRRFIKYFSKVASPLFGLLAKDSEFLWSESCQEALEPLEDKLTTTPILQGPNWYLPFHIHVDASHKAIGAAMGQIDDKIPYAIYFINKIISKVELKWLLLLQKFYLTIIDKPNRENAVAYFLSKLTLPASEEGMVDDQLPNEHLFAISFLSPCFYDIANYLVATKFPPNLSSKKKSGIIRKSSPFTWIRGNLFKLGLDEILRRCVKEEEFFDILLS